MSQYIGKTISLISNKGVRYVGLLYNISAEEATVALQSVRSFGTEGRMAEQGQPNLEVLPGTDVYDFVTFRGSDVKDLSVLDIPLDEVQPVNYQPSATQSTSTASTAAPTAASTTTATGTAAAAGPATGTAENSQQRSAVPATTTGTSSGAASSNAASGAAPGAAASMPKPTSAASATSAAELHQQPPAADAATTTTQQAPTQTRPVVDAQPGARPTPPTRTSGPENTEGEFDFESANARFQKEDKDEMPTKTVYNKSTSFFDSISLNEHGNMRWAEEKDLNMDTFGESSVRRGRGNWRGRGRGRGNWRGRGGNRGRGRQEPKPEWA
ncbi:hypothetical protein PUMCH_002775 [Australozyma saopauloensis]|uniref:Protein SCD6 n=1 Tax=Australozyma saopauloensis TaxID=291208 RepID=A0AAX4HAB4_9ASCO|nr:hypothetical protein PUMCH_002775 [[Candida] saopauloensis]